MLGKVVVETLQNREQRCASVSRHRVNQQIAVRAAADFHLGNVQTKFLRNLHRLAIAVYEDAVGQGGHPNASSVHYYAPAVTAQAMSARIKAFLSIDLPLLIVIYYIWG